MTHRFPSLLILLLLLDSVSLMAKLKLEQATLFVAPQDGSPSVKGDFKFTNAGDRPIEILKTTPACGCTTAILSKSVYAPGESGVITAVFTIGGRVGRQTKTVLVRTDENEANEYLLTLETKIAQELSIEPSVVFWRHDDTARTRSIAIKYMTRGGMKLVGASEPSGFFQIAIQASSDASGSTVALTPGSTEKGVQRLLLLQFETKSGRRIERGVVLRVLPDPRSADRLIKSPAGSHKSTGGQ